MSASRKYELQDPSEIIRLCHDADNYISASDLSDGVEYHGRAFAKMGLRELPRLIADLREKVDKLEHLTKDLFNEV